MAFTDPYQRAAVLSRLVAKPEPVTAAAFSFVSWEADFPTFPLAVLRLPVGCQGSTEVDGRFLEHLRTDLVAPCQARHPPRDDTARSGDEDSSGGLATLPDVEGADQIELRPWDHGVGVSPFSGEGINHKTQTLVICESGRACVTTEHPLLLGRWSKRKAECRVAHFAG
jgi:hypothetical protein